MLPILPKRQPEQDKQGQYFERRGERVTHRIAEAVARKSWKWTLVNLAWTAGPVTFIALQGGHYIGFGDKAPLKSFIYFAGYTIIAGVLAVIATLVRDAFYKPKVDKQQEQLLRAIDRLFRYMVACRNHILTGLEPAERRIMAAYYLLQGANASPSTVGTAVMDLTGHAELAEAARRIDVFSEQGMQSRVRDEWREIRPLLQQVRVTLEPTAPQAYMLLESRLKGKTPRVREGIPRTGGFIYRALDAAQASDPDLMTIQDAWDVITLGFELLNGRRIAVLELRFRGDSHFEEVRDELDMARRSFRQALRRRNSMLRLLLDRLNQQVGLEIVIEATQDEQRLVDSLLSGLRGMDRLQRMAYRQDYERLFRLNREAILRRQKLLKTLVRYAKVWQREGHRLTLALPSEHKQQAGFYVEERFIYLDDREKLAFASEIKPRLEGVAYKQDTAQLKRAATEIINALDKMIEVGGPEEQLSIETSNAANFGSLTIDLTPQTKAGWANQAIEALHENRRRASHRIAKNLVHVYRVRLDDAIIDWFVARFGADRDYLLSLREEAGTLLADNLAAAPAPLKDIPSWQRLGQSQPG